MPSISIWFLFIFSLLLISSSSKDPLIILPNTTQSSILTRDDFHSFKIPQSLSPAIGNFNVWITSEVASGFYVAANPHICGDFSRELPFEYEFLQRGMIMSFDGNASENYCFDIKLLMHSKNEIIGNFTISIMFTPIYNVLILDTPFKFELKKETPSKFTYNLQNNSAQILYINLKTIQELPSKSMPNSSIELKHPKGVCFQTQTSTSISWLCDLSDSLGQIGKFSMVDGLNDGLYEIFVSKIEPIVVDPNLKIMSHSLISGFGTIYCVPLDGNGMLQIKASLENNEYLPVIADVSIAGLFKTLGKYETFNQFIKNYKTQSERYISIQNNRTNDYLYYFVADNGLNKFSLNSCFLQQITVDTETETIHYIDPDLDPYRYVQLGFNDFEPNVKYKVTLETQQSESLMSLFYYTVNSSNGTLPTFLEKNAIGKSNLSSSRILSLTFAVKDCNSSIYLGAYANKKGFYMITVSKVRSVSFLGVAIIIGFSAFGVLMIYGFVQMLIFRKMEAFDTSEFSISSRDDPEEDIISQNNTHITVDINNFNDQLGLREANCDENMESKNLFMITHSRGQIIIKPLKEANKNEIQLKETCWKLNKNKDEKKLDEIEETDRCDICYEEKETAIFYPCNHSCACNHCAIKVIQISLKCPLCRGEIQAVQLNIKT